jgi:hypothetical protein
LHSRVVPLNLSTATRCYPITTLNERPTTCDAPSPRCCGLDASHITASVHTLRVGALRLVQSGAGCGWTGSTAGQMSLNNLVAPPTQAAERACAPSASPAEANGQGRVYGGGPTPHPGVQAGSPGTTGPGGPPAPWEPRIVETPS